MSKREILCCAVLVAVLIMLFAGCALPKWRVTLTDGRSCVGKPHYSGKGRIDFHCDDGVIYVNVINARMERY